MINLYIDFDGVIMDTAERIEIMMFNSGINRKDNLSVAQFCKNILWDSLLQESVFINNSDIYLNNICQSNKFNICILTHVCTEEESIIKKEYIMNKFSNIKIITVPREKEKHECVCAKNAILIDDYSRNLDSWINNGGVGIKFTNEKDCPYKSINSLNDITNIIEKLKSDMEMLE